MKGLVIDSGLEQLLTIGQWIMSNDLVLSNDGNWHLTLFGFCLVIGQQIKMVRHSNGPWNSQAKRQTKNEGMDAKKRKRKATISVTGGTTYIVCSRLCGTVQLVLDGKFQNNPGPIYQYKTRSICNSAIHKIWYSEKSQIFRKTPPSPVHQNVNLFQGMPLSKICFIEKVPGNLVF